MASMALGAALQQIHRLFHEGAVAALPDDQLLARFVTARDEAAFEALVARHGPMVLALCHAILKDEHAAEDAFQATFLVFARKAGSLWAHDSLGGWLHRVAYRIALRANADTRVRREKEAAVVRPERDETWSDWIPMLHEEIDRMPDRHRAPIVLCDLQELTYEQAAQQLQWTVPTLRCRLAKAREQLRGRLTRRGLTEAGATLGILLGSSAAKGAMPLAAIRAATELAMNGGATGTISALAAGMLKGMRLARIKVIASLVMTVGVTACVASATLAAGLGQADNPPPEQSQAIATTPPARIPAAATPVRAPDDEVLNYRGRVVTPDGHPFPGAKLYMVTERAPSPPKAIAGPDGRFEFAVDLSQFDDPIYARHARVTAAAQGFGIGMTDSETPDAGRDLTIRLAADLPIEGQVVDTEGRPVAGASVRTTSLWSSLKENLDPWLAAIKAKESELYAAQYKYLNIRFPLADRAVGAIPSTTTDSQGRFRLTGIGRERLAELRIEAPTIRIMEVEVLTRRCDPVQTLTDPRFVDSRLITYHGASPRLVASPSRPIEGVVRDKQTGKPIAGAKVSSYTFADTKQGNHTILNSTSDAQGRYRIHGMPRGSGNELITRSLSIEPYLPTRSTLDDPPGLGTIKHDIELVRGTLLEGRITNIKTGAPVRAAIRYHVATDNPNLGAAPGLRHLPNDGYDFVALTGTDGNFQIAALPGRGLLSVEPIDNGFPQMDPEIKKPLEGKYIPELMGFYGAVVEIDVSSPGPRKRYDIPLEPGLTLAADLLDPDGKPLKGVLAYGLEYLGGWSYQPQKDATVLVRGLKSWDEKGQTGQIRSGDGDKIIWSPRTLVFLHEGRKLAGWIDVRGNEAGPLRIRLAPSATTIGRVVDADGNPRVDLTLRIEVVGKARIGDGTIEHLPRRIRTDADGRFRIEGLAPGLTYRAIAQAPPNQRAKERIEVAATTPGEVHDLGVMTITFQDREK
ncbi:RNA polymerase sigma factor, sigma-70 family [Singulisphaera sp. GP187]|uniref:sigma-70 family RNA polymerase sigma factor n=1 Tax=Singulisphaera sp. GP187 TaxID=1882752 RepID=UPI00092CC180|nr:sigma-70 family RNA polymerase sigma factor [Singulisphaera sp. GP187]SIO28293.1 RNA polymerase sigma factor, sigma-70 family [Singulisphaera sp. GP187]